MAPLETQSDVVVPQDAPFELSKDDLERFVKRSLFKLDKMDRDHPDFQADAEARLTWAENDLKQLEAAYPQDSDVKVLREMYEDLKKDFEQNFGMNFDSSFDIIVGEMETELKMSGVRVETPEETILTGTVQELETIGIHPSYVVTQGDANAPTIVLYMMIHL